MKSRTIHLTLAILFGLFAILQYNDPDPLVWILIYGSVAVISLLKVYLKQVNFRPLVITLMVIFILYAATYIPSVIQFMGKPDKLELVGTMKVSKPWIEGTREFLGLMMGIGALYYLMVSNVKK